MASVADTEASREQGLSGTITLPPTVVKLFVFDHNDRWSFWMKDMHYPIDIIWLNENHQVVYLVPNVTPDSYPETFIPPLPARYVIETAAGLSATHHIIPGTLVAF